MHVICVGHYPAISRVDCSRKTIHVSDCIGICSKGLLSPRKKRGWQWRISKFPGAFRKKTSWKTFEMVLNYLRTTNRVNRILLKYIMYKKYDPGQEEIAYATEHASLVVTTPLEGHAFDTDNSKVWSVLKDLTLKWHAYAYISHLDRMRNGRTTIKALHSHYEGELATKQTKAQAYKKISNASYIGKKQNWMFKKYIILYQKSHQLFEEYGNWCHQQIKCKTWLMEFIAPMR